MRGGVPGALASGATFGFDGTRVPPTSSSNAAPLAVAVAVKSAVLRRKSRRRW
jgi:hypothetical protein